MSPVNVLNAAIKETPPDDNETKEFLRLGEKLEGKDCRFCHRDSENFKVIEL